MRRKVVQQGPSTLMISLPSKWVKKTGINKGDEVDVEIKDGNLLISTDAFNANKEIDITLHEESERYIRSYLGRLYRKGFSKINITFQNQKTLNHIKKAVNNIIGADIIETNINSCIIEIFSSSTNEIDFEKNIIKMLISLRTIFNIFQEDLFRKEFNSLETLDELRHNNLKIKDYILRHAHIKNIDNESFSNLAHITFCYEKIGSKFVGFYKRYAHMINLKSKDHIEIIKKINLFIDWLIKKISKKEKVSISDETKFRNDLLKFNISLFNDLHNNKDLDNAFLTIIYLISELLDSSISYISAHKEA